MTNAELNGVRALNERIVLKEREIKHLKLLRTQLTPPPADGLPRSPNRTSRTEILTVKILDAEKLLEEWRLMLEQLKMNLLEKIMAEWSEPTDQMILILRYVELCSYREISRRLNYSLSSIFKVHDKIVNAVNAVNA